MSFLAYTTDLRTKHTHDILPTFVLFLGVQEEEDLELDDAEMLAGLEAQEEVQRIHVRPVQDSGYRTLSEISSQSSRSSTVRSFVSTASSRWVVNNMMP